MNRLQQKCVFASAGLHLLLVLALLLGSAFQRPGNESTASTQAPQGDAPPLLILPTPAQATAPGAAAAGSAATTQPDLRTANNADLTLHARDSDSFLPEPKRPKTPRVSTNLVSRPVVGTRPGSDHQTATADDSAARVGRAADRILHMISPGTSIDLGSDTGSAGGDASYAQIVKEYYSRNWNPHGFTRDDGTTIATVIIASDGRVVAAKITKSSDDTALDETVQRALDQVRSIQPFENGAREKQRTFTINFNAKVKDLSQ